MFEPWPEKALHPKEGQKRVLKSPIYQIDIGQKNRRPGMGRLRLRSEGEDYSVFIDAVPSHWAVKV